jgi:hypothetical protein
MESSIMQSSTTSMELIERLEDLRQAVHDQEEEDYLENNMYSNKREHEGEFVVKKNFLKERLNNNIEGSLASFVGCIANYYGLIGKVKTIKSGSRTHHEFLDEYRHWKKLSFGRFKTNLIYYYHLNQRRIYSAFLDTSSKKLRVIIKRIESDVSISDIHFPQVFERDHVKKRTKLYSVLKDWIRENNIRAISCNMRILPSVHGVRRNMMINDMVGVPTDEDVEHLLSTKPQDYRKKK